MNELYVYYVLVDIPNSQEAYAVGIRNRLNLVIAESEDSAISIMRTHIGSVHASISVPDFPNSVAAEAVGHGTEVSTFLQHPEGPIRYKDLIDFMKDKYNNYYSVPQDSAKDINILLWDDSGEVKLLNDYTHGEYKKKEPDGTEINNNFVIITKGQEDELKGGIAFVGDKTIESTEDSANTKVDNSIIISNTSYSSTGEEVILQDNLQVKLTVQGEILVRRWSADSQSWSEWQLSPIFVPEAPQDGKTYVRTLAEWKALQYDSIPTSGSEHLVTSGNIYNYVENAVVKVYRYQGSRTVSEISAITNAVVGDVYNVKDSGVLGEGDHQIDVKVGDNVAWDGESWDNLNGIFDHSEYVKFTDYATTTNSGVVKIKNAGGILVDTEGTLSVDFAETDDIHQKSSAKSITPNILDYGVYTSTHQSMSDTYDVDTIPSHESIPGGSGSLPVSYDAVKHYIDSRPNSGSTVIVSGDYQTIEDESFTTTAKTVSGAIEELNDKIDVVVCSLVAGWNVVKLNKLYPISWVFSAKPYCYSVDGYSMDFRIRHADNNVVDGVHAFEIYVPEDCELRCSVSPWNAVSGVPADYMLISYYYTGVDGDDLDTMTVATGASEIGHAGYETGSNKTTITATNSDGHTAILAKWGGDNIGGGTGSKEDKFYEEIILDLNAINNYDAHDLNLVLYGAWYESKMEGNIHVSVSCYKGSLDLSTLNSNNFTKRFDLSDLGEPTYHNPAELVCFIPSEVDKGDSNNFKSTYTKAFGVKIHHTAASSNTCTFEISRLA